VVWPSASRAALPDTSGRLEQAASWIPLSGARALLPESGFEKLRALRATDYAKSAAQARLGCPMLARNGPAGAAWRRLLLRIQRTCRAGRGHFRF
jgi:hypothetical protein